MSEKPVETLNVHGRRVLDVSGLPDSAIDSYAPVWWGNALLIFIESTTVVLLLAIYFYIRRNFTEWPPTQPLWVPPLFNPVPDLPLPTVELILAVLSCFLMYRTDMAARRQEAGRVKVGIWIMVAIAAAITAMRFFEMSPDRLKFRWDENAYGSIVWVILGTHLTYLLGALAEFFIMAMWVTKHSFDPKHGLDITLMGGYWYWAVTTWVACYATVYIGARVL
jgi:heme/copper-type cytochrome/quinol oxidase subunit 3